LPGFTFKSLSGTMSSENLVLIIDLLNGAIDRFDYSTYI
jgi:hypothetical protein